MRMRTIAISLLTLVVQALGPVSPARAADPVTVTFSFTGAEQEWVVPDRVTSIHVVIIGGRGGSAAVVPGGGAHGDRVTGDLAVTPGFILYFQVAGNGADGTTSGGTGGFNGGGAGGPGATFVQGAGGGGGGGASDIRMVPRSDPATLGSRLIVAAGGAGGGGGPSGGVGGTPGLPGIDGASGTLPGRGGGGATATEGGGGGIGGGGGLAGTFGSLAQGGRGGSNSLFGDGGGGGGGGLYGGGGGGGGDASAGGGGGGGSTSLGSATNTAVETDTTGTPLIEISYVDAGGGSSTGTVDAVVTMASSAVCLELSTAAIDFGTRQFGEVGAQATPSIGVTNCGGITETILARGTHADGPEGGWALVDSGSCVDETLVLDQFRLRLLNPNTFDELSLVTTNRTVDSMAAGVTTNHTALMDTPCPGSSGAGSVMAMQIVFVATE
jgi:hypothetical protein